MKKIKNPFLDEIPECGFSEEIQYKYETHIVYAEHKPSEESIQELNKVAELLTGFLNKGMK